MSREYEKGTTQGSTNRMMSTHLTFKVKDGTEVINPMEVADILARAWVSTRPSCGFEPVLYGSHRAMESQVIQSLCARPAQRFPSAAAALGKLVEVQILGAHPRSSESETLELGLLNLQFTNLQGIPTQLNRKTDMFSPQ